MASCHNCGKPNLKKRKCGRRYCSRCGFLPGVAHVDRSGNAPTLTELEKVDAMFLGVFQEIRTDMLTKLFGVTPPESFTGEENA